MKAAAAGEDMLESVKDQLEKLAYGTSLHEVMEKARYDRKSVVGRLVSGLTGAANNARQTFMYRAEVKETEFNEELDGHI